MAQSTGIVITAGTISFTNAWLHSGEPNFKIAIATFGAALIIDAVERLNTQAGMGLAVIMLITVVLTPTKNGGESPAARAASLVVAKPSKS